MCDWQPITPSTNVNSTCEWRIQSSRAAAELGYIRVAHVTLDVEDTKSAMNMSDASMIAMTVLHSRLPVLKWTRKYCPLLREWISEKECGGVLPTHIRLVERSIQYVT
jgi:hypothetical protein